MTHHFQQILHPLVPSKPHVPQHPDLCPLLPLHTILITHVLTFVPQNDHAPHPRSNLSIATGSFRRNQLPFLRNPRIYQSLRQKLIRPSSTRHQIRRSPSIPWPKPHHRHGQILPTLARLHPSPTSLHSLILPEWILETVRGHLVMTVNLSNTRWIRSLVRRGRPLRRG